MLYLWQNIYIKKYLQAHMKTHDPKKINDGLNFIIADKASKVSKNIAY